MMTDGVAPSVAGGTGGVERWSSSVSVYLMWRIEWKVHTPTVELSRESIRRPDLIWCFR